jgi:hypothetical protein
MSSKRVVQALERATMLFRNAAECAQSAADWAKIGRFTSAAQRAEDAMWYADLALKELEKALKTLGVKLEGGEKKDE